MPISTILVTSAPTDPGAFERVEDAPGICVVCPRVFSRSPDLEGPLPKLILVLSMLGQRPVHTTQAGVVQALDRPRMSDILLMACVVCMWTEQGGS